MLAAAIPVLTPPLAGLALPRACEVFAEWPSYWKQLRNCRPDPGHHDEAAELAGRFVEAMAGETLMHTDVRDDNILLVSDGRTLLCDWNWPLIGAPWIDSLFLLIGPRGDGLDVEAVIARSPVLSAVPEEAIDIALALVVGYFWYSAEQPVPATSPFLRAVQQAQGDVCWHWLAERRSWNR